MYFRQILTLFQDSKLATHLLQLHALILKTAFDHDHYVLSHFILSSSSVSIELSRLIFDNSPITPPLFAWNTIIKEYSKNSRPIESVKLFTHLQTDGLKPDKFTYPFVLKSCGRCSMVAAGGSLHSLILKTGFDLDRHISNTLLRMYAACSAIGSASQVFDEMTDRDVVSWSSIIAGYVDCDHPFDALAVFQEMKLQNVMPNSITMVSLLSASTQLLNCRLGESIHTHIIIKKIELEVVLGTALLEMYAKCGQVDKAFLIFKSMKQRNLHSWTVMISGFADDGRGKEVIYLFSKMKKTGLKPDNVLFSAILSACSHLGLVEEGQKYFDQMVTIYGISPMMEHYGCMVDMFGRAGMIEQAYQIIMSMPVKPNSIILRSFISSCKHHDCTLFLDDNLRKCLIKMEPDIGANYVLSSSVSSLSTCWSDAGSLRATMKNKNIKKVPGCSWVEINDSCADDIVKEAEN